MRADGDGLSELDGQLLLDLGSADDDDAERDLSPRPRRPRRRGGYAEAAALYGRCLAHRPRRLGGRVQPRQLPARRRPARPRPAHDYARAHQARPGFVEAWFNLAGLLARARAGSTRRAGICSKAIALDPDYADAVFNLATLEFDAGDLAAARRWWARYLELDSDSEWARTAARGLQFVDLQLRADAGRLRWRRLPLRRPGGRARHHPARAWRRRADGFGVDDRDGAGAGRRRGLRVARFEFGYMAAPPHAAGASRRRGPRR